ncbi:hypothetical protein KCG53_10615 [Neisseria subflava]|uniref:Uncharacterized protein n=1 Tax=Neisseria subflava TaxID=28449 RepID=A0A9X9I5S9_NEISU|nr:hypothetical protein KCG53_10615 [Neisseria subflava]
MLGLIPSEVGGSELLLNDTDWLRSAVWMSLGTDARARSDDVLPDGAGISVGGGAIPTVRKLLAADYGY